MARGCACTTARAKCWAACRSPAPSAGGGRRARTRWCGCASSRPRSLRAGDRFILRAYSPPVTIGGGRIIDPFPTRPGVRSAEALAALERLQAFGDASRDAELPALEEMVAATKAAGLAVSALISRGGVAPAASGADRGRADAARHGGAGGRPAGRRRGDQAGRRGARRAWSPRFTGPIRSVKASPVRRRASGSLPRPIRPSSSWWSSN